MRTFIVLSFAAAGLILFYKFMILQDQRRKRFKSITPRNVRLPGIQEDAWVRVLTGIRSAQDHDTLDRWIPGILKFEETFGRVSQDAEILRREYWSQGRRIGPRRR